MKRLLKSFKNVYTVEQCSCIYLRVQLKCCVNIKEKQRNWSRTVWAQLSPGSCSCCHTAAELHSAAESCAGRRAVGGRRWVQQSDWLDLAQLRQSTPAWWDMSPNTQHDHVQWQHLIEAYKENISNMLFHAVLILVETNKTETQGHGISSCLVKKTNQVSFCLCLFWYIVPSFWKCSDSNNSGRKMLAFRAITFYQHRPQFCQ